MERCQTCGVEKEEYDIIDPETGDIVDTELVCPNEWKEKHYQMENEL